MVFRGVLPTASTQAAISTTSKAPSGLRVEKAMAKVFSLLCFIKGTWQLQGEIVWPYTQHLGLMGGRELHRTLKTGSLGGSSLNSVIVNQLAGLGVPTFPGIREDSIYKTTLFHQPLSNSEQ